MALDWFTVGSTLQLPFATNASSTVAYLKSRNSKMTNDTHVETQNASTVGSKARRITASMFFKKASKQEEQLKDETIRKLQEENNKLRQELVDANSRIRKLESAERENRSPSPKSTSDPSETETLAAREFVEHRDDDGWFEDIDDNCDDFSVEVEAITVASSTGHELFNKYDDETQSTTSSVCTTPTGNDKISNFQRRQHQIRDRLRRSTSNSSRGEKAHLNYFFRRSNPLEKASEMNTRRSLLDDSSSVDSVASVTSDFSASFDSSLVHDDKSADGRTLMSGRMLPLHAMKSLLRASSAESDAVSFVPDNEPVLFGEI